MGFLVNEDMGFTVYFAVSDSVTGGDLELTERACLVFDDHFK
jgi:hypothetical protein